jgi:uncharacterized membrane protein
MFPMSVRRRFFQFNWRVLPASLWLLALICDLVFLTVQDPLWYSLAFYGISAGLAVGILVGVTAFVTWLRIADPHWRAIGVAHMTSYLMVALLLALSLVLRSVTPTAQPILAVILSGVAIALFLSSAWIDDELDQAYRHRHTISWTS